MSIVTVANLVKEYPRNGSAFAAVSEVNLQVRPGELLGIVGRSGSGKTTLLNLIAGLLKPSSGTVRIQGVDINSLADAKLSRLRNECIGFVPQGQSLLPNLTVFDNVRLPHYFADRDDDVARRTDFLLEELGIAHLAGAYPASLSGGEMRRVAIARAMVNRPPLLLADEPTSDLDMDNIHAVMDIFARLADKGVAVLFSTHEDEAVRRAGRVMEMAGGVLTERMLQEA